ncbi:MAG: hypothetical protein HUJ98_04375, partial [Bacteroidaceae bacterium]|nr:hypothetical protein [Bacteroidaceae bacterium]
WTPIGLDEDGKKYEGTFDGHGHTISGLYINSGSIQNAGLFSANMGEIKNVGIVDSYFYASKNIGALCGINYGTISNCYNTGAVGPNAGNYSYIGGVCGQNQGGTIENCYNTGKVNACTDDGYYGGVCGLNIDSGTISCCYNTTEITGDGLHKRIGGVCGYNIMSNILNCYNIAKITASGMWQTIGGVCGQNQGGTIENCYNTGLLVTDGGNCGSVCGFNTRHEEIYETEYDYTNLYYDGEIYNSYYIEGTANKGVGLLVFGSARTTDMTAQQFSSGEVAWLLNGSTAEGDLAWYQNLSKNADAYPVLDSGHGKVYHGYDCCKLGYSNSHLSTTSSVVDNGFCTICGSPQEAIMNGGFYEIANAGQLYWFAEQVNSG